MKSYLLVCLMAAQSGMAFAQEGALLYAGSTASNGWQIFRFDLPAGPVTQLSFSPGDKRDPQYCRARKVVACRDTLGRVLQLDGQNESILVSNLDGCANYSLAADGRSVYFTKPAAERMRQNIWRQNLDEKAPRLAATVPEGMLKQVSASPDGKWLAATHIWRANEERLVLIAVDGNRPIKYLTPEKSLDAFPHWTADSDSILFATVAAGKTYVIRKANLDDKAAQMINANPGMDECNPVSDKGGRFIFFEQRTPDGSVIACLDTKSKSLRKLPLPQEARDPFWYENK